MHKHFFTGALALGAIAVLWVGSGFFWSANVLALLVTLAIAAVYGFGALELHRFRQATATLQSALHAIPDGLTELGGWLGSVHASLQNPVRMRIEGERIGLPGPALTPYLVGLLVMLGMLGTFLGMVVTLNGAVFALEGTTDLQAIRSAFAAPIKGLGLAFGTSVAGVATSAMLGLMSAVSRRERMQAAQRLDSCIATTLRGFSLTHQRQETFKALQQQSQALPAVAAQLQTLVVQMERMNQQMNERLLANQEGFHQDVKTVYAGLAASVDQSLRDSLTRSAQAAGEAIQPVIASAFADIATNTRQVQERMVDGLGQSVAAFSTSFEQRSAVWLQTVAEQAQTNARNTQTDIAALMAASEELVRTRIAAEAAWTAQHSERMDQMTQALRSELSTLRDEETVRANAAVQRLGELQTALTVHLTTLGTALEEPIARLIQTASEAPRAAAEVIGTLRKEVSNSAARDNELLEERTRILATLNTLLDSIRHASSEQRVVIDSLVASSAVALQNASSQFVEQVGAETGKLSDIAAHVTSSAVEVSALGETFGFAVRSFVEANETLIGNLQRIEGAMDKSMARSDDQLAYYVAQAREIIDLSILSQKETFEALRQLPGQTDHSAHTAEETA